MQNNNLEGLDEFLYQNYTSAGQEELEDERLARQSKWDREMEEADNAWSER